LPHSKLQPDIRLSTLRIDLGLMPYLLFFAFLGTAISIASTFDDFHELVVFIFIKLGAAGVLYLFWHLFAYLLEARDKSNLKIPHIMFIGFLGGIVFALSEEVMCWILKYRLNLDFAQRAFSYAIAATFWFPAGAVVSRNLKRYKRLRGEVREQFLQQESVRLARALALKEYQKQIEGQIQEQLKVTSNEAAGLLNSLRDSDTKRVPEYLRVISGEYFSLMGRSLSQGDSQRLMYISRLRGGLSTLLKTLYESVLTRPLNPLWFTTMVTATILQSLQRSFSFVGVLEIASLIFISVYLVQKLQLIFFQHSGVRYVVTTIVFTILTIVLPLALVRVIFPIHAELFRWAGFGLLILVVTISGHFAQAGLLRIEDFKLESNKELSKVKRDEQEVNLLFLQITKDWASYIHGSITSKLESAAIEIEHALKEDDLEAVAKAIERVNQYLKSESAVKRSSEMVLLDEVNEKVRAWGGVIAIEVESNISRDEAVEVSIGDVGACIEEAILNATRHGDCSSIKIELIDTESTFRVICTDNGIGFNGVPTGLGTRIFNQASQGQWSLQRDTTRALTVLTLDFPKSAADALP
jgi:signal transduction histidine kinase